MSGHPAESSVRFLMRKAGGWFPMMSGRQSMEFLSNQQHVSGRLAQHELAYRTPSEVRRAARGLN